LSEETELRGGETGGSKDPPLQQWLNS
jgi:hypothetical protein